MKNVKKTGFIFFIIFFTFTHAFALEMVLMGRVDEFYDDNINSSNTEPESDWITNIMLGITLNSEMRVLDFNLSGNIYQRYSLHDEESNQNYQDMLFVLNKSFTENISLRISNEFQRYPESRTFGTLFGRSEANTGYVSNGFSSGLFADVTEHLFFGITYNNGIMKNESEEMVDTISHNPGGIAGYHLNASNIIRAGYLYTIMKYDDGNESRGERGFAEYERHITDQLFAVFHGGYDYITSAEGQSLGSRWMFSLTNDIDARNNINITYLKESTISNIVNDTLNNWTLSGTLQRIISLRTGIGLSLFYGEGTYEISGVSYELFGISASISYIVTEFINFHVGYNHIWNSTSAPGLEKYSYNRNQVSAGLSAAY